MALFEDLTQRPSSPSPSQVRGAPPMPARSNTFVNPPAAATAPVGRPPSPPSPSPGGAGRTLPTTGVASPAAPSPSAGSARGRTAAPQAEQAPGVGMPVFQLDHMPTRSELATLPEGMQISTPYGQVTRDGQLLPSPEGAQLYQQAVVRARQDFGPHPFAGDPNAPPPPIRLGRAWINPFTGRWGVAR